MNKDVCEQATGCVQKGKITYYDNDGDKISTKEAIRLSYYGFIYQLVEDTLSLTFEDLCNISQY